VPNCRELPDLVDYFDTTHVTASARRIGTLQRLRHLRRAMLWLLCACVASCRPFCQTRKWNVHDVTLTHGDRTDNPWESWNNGFRQLVGHSHPDVWTTIESLQLDQAMSVTSLMQHARGQLPPKRVRRTTVQRQKRHRTYRSTGLGTATSLLHCWLFQCRDCYYGFYIILYFPFISFSTSAFVRIKVFYIFSVL